MDTDAKTVTLADGSSIDYDELIIATGLVPKRIASFPDLPGIHVLRSFDESLKLRKRGRARRGTRSSSAPDSSAARWRPACAVVGVDVVLVEPQPAPLASVLGEQIG